MDDADDKVSVSTLTADGHTQLAKMFRKNICDKNFWEIVRTIKKRIDDVELVREGFIAIGDLAFESQLSQKVLGEVGACGTVIYGMKLHAKHLGIAFTGLTAVTALLLNGNADNVVKMTQAGGCEVVVDVLNRHLECAYVALGGALAVHRLAEGHPDNAVVLGTSGAGGLIIRVMRQHMDKQDLVLAGLKALNAMCLHNPDNTRQCIDDGAYEMVIVVLGVHKHDMDIVLMGCVAIVLLAHKRVDPPTPAVSPRPCSSPNSSIQLAQYAQTSVIMSIPSSISVSAVSGVSSSSALTFEVPYLTPAHVSSSIVLISSPSSPASFTLHPCLVTGWHADHAARRRARRDQRGQGAPPRQEHRGRGLPRDPTHHPQLLPSTGHGGKFQPQRSHGRGRGGGGRGGVHATE